MPPQGKIVKSWSRFSFSYGRTFISSPPKIVRNSQKEIARKAGETQSKRVTTNGSFPPSCHFTRATKFSELFLSRRVLACPLHVQTCSDMFGLDQTCRNLQMANSLSSLFTYICKPSVYTRFWANFVFTVIDSHRNCKNSQWFSMDTLYFDRENIHHKALMLSLSFFSVELNWMVDGPWKSEAHLKERIGESTQIRSVSDK